MLKFRYAMFHRMFIIVITICNYQYIRFLKTKINNLLLYILVKFGIKKKCIDGYNM